MTSEPRGATARSGWWRRGVPAVLGGACVLGGAGLVAWGLHPAPAPDAPLPTAPFSVAATGRPGDPVRGATTSTASKPEALPTPGPSRLVVPSLGIDAPIDDVALDPSGGLVVPGDPARVGRWTGAAASTARKGTTLLAGHVDSDGRLGALHGLSRAAPAARIVTTDAAGRPTTWQVVALETRHKDDVPAFPATGPRRLVVVTCGGRVLRTSAGFTYEDNVVVTAVPDRA